MADGTAATPHPLEWAPGHMDVFWRGSDDALHHDWYGGGAWHGDSNLGGAGSMASDPYPISTSPGRMEVFWKGNDGSLWHTWYDGTWHAPSSLGDTGLASAPHPVSWGAGQMDVFWKAADGTLFHDWYGNGWHGAQSLGGTGTGTTDPYPVSWGFGHEDVFWKGADGALWHEWFGNGWQGVASLGGTLQSDPHPASWGVGHIDVFWQGTDNNLWHEWFGSGWQGASNIGGSGTVASDPSPITRGVGNVEVFWKSSNGQLAHTYFANGWQGVGPMGFGSLVGAPNAIASPLHIEVFWADTVGTLKHYWTDFPPPGVAGKPQCGIPPGSVLPGKVIIISLTCQELTAYDNGQVIMDTLITTGRPALPTLPGWTTVYGKNHPFLMVSPWPAGSAYWYAPSVVQYVTWFRSGGYGIHDAYWQPDSTLGPGSNLTGYASHGCVHVPLSIAMQMYYWADIGTPVLVA